jgi:hypothetical protein
LRAEPIDIVNPTKQRYRNGISHIARMLPPSLRAERTKLVGRRLVEFKRDGQSAQTRSRIS